MAGGIGSRFWPISRADKPKQFLKFNSLGESFLRLTYDRMKQIIPEENIIVVSLTKYKDLVMEHLPELRPENLLLEPYNRNTAPCITFATYTLLKRDPLAVTVVTPADHLIPDGEVFNAAIYNALAYAAGSDALITLGVMNDRSILRATEELLVPGGIRSLNALHPLYRGVYTGDEDTSRKQAYHNGTVWAWPFPLYAEALAMTGAATREATLSLLAGAVENLNAGCLGHLSEIADGDAPHAQKGCIAQAWSDSELLRVWLKLGGK